MLGLSANRARKDKVLKKKRLGLWPNVLSKASKNGSVFAYQRFTAHFPWIIEECMVKNRAFSLQKMRWLNRLLLQVGMEVDVPKNCHRQMAKWRLRDDKGLGMQQVDTDHAASMVPV